MIHAHDVRARRAEGQRDDLTLRDVKFADVLSAMLAVAVTLMSVTIVLSWVAFSAR